MTAPLSRYLTRFSAPLVVPVESAMVPVPAPEPLLMFTADEFEARLAAAREEALTPAQARHADDMAALAAAHEAAMGETLAAARAEWSAAEGERLAALIEAANAALRDLVCERTVAVLRPWLAAAATARAKADLREAFDRLLADAKVPSLRVGGPADLLEAMREARPDAPVEWSVTDTIDVAVIADATRLGTRLAAALADLTVEGAHVG